MARLTAERIGKSFGDIQVVSDVSLDVRDGEFIAVLGPSGCGKTTLLRMIAGFEPVTTGRLTIGDTVVSDAGIHVPPERRRVGIVFQNYALWPHMSVAENVGYALRVAKVDRASRDRRVAEALALVNLTGLEDRRPANLSGGQRQRVALARALVAAPSLVLFDEPLANLDVHLRAAMEDEFAAFHKRTGTTIVYITHDQAEAMALADRIAVMDHGRLIQLATPRTLYHEPANAMVASFISQGMLIPADILTAEDAGHCRARVLGQEVVVRCGKSERPRAGATLCCRSRDLAFAGEGFEAEVLRSTYKGGSLRVELTPAGRPDLSLHMSVPDSTDLEPGARPHVAIRSGWILPAGAA